MTTPAIDPLMTANVVASPRENSPAASAMSGAHLREAMGTVEGFDNHPTGTLAMIGLRLALGFLFFWAFIDKLFGLGYSTARSKSWLNGGSPTHGFLAGAQAGPLQGFFRWLGKLEPGMDWLFMIGLLGIGLALLLGVAIRPAALSGVVLVLMMWCAVWPAAKVAGGQPTASTNPFVDEHILEALALLVVMSFAGTTTGFLGRWWSSLEIVQKFPWLR